MDTLKPHRLATLHIQDDAVSIISRRYYGFLPRVFHDRCDGKSPTFTFMKAKNTPNLCMTHYPRSSWNG